MGDGDARMKASFATALSKVILCLNFRTSFVPAALFRFRWLLSCCFSGPEMPSSHMVSVLSPRLSSSRGRHRQST